MHYKDEHGANHRGNIKSILLPLLYVGDMYRNGVWAFSKHHKIMFDKIQPGDIFIFCIAETGKFQYAGMAQSTYYDNNNNMKNLYWDERSPSFNTPNTDWKNVVIFEKIVPLYDGDFDKDCINGWNKKDVMKKCGIAGLQSSLIATKGDYLDVLKRAVSLFE
jgi:hypothetical protein